MDVTDHNPVPRPHYSQVAATSRLLNQFESIDSLLRQLKKALNHSGPEAAKEYEHKPSDVRAHARDILILVGDFSDDLPRFAPDVITLQGVAEVLRELRLFFVQFCRKLDELCMRWPETMFVAELNNAPELKPECHRALVSLGLECSSASQKIDRAAAACDTVARSLNNQVGNLQREFSNELGTGPMQETLSQP